MENKRYSKVKCGVCGATGVRLYRPYGSFYREEDNSCLAHIRPTAVGFYVPLVLSDTGDPWGYSSAAQDDMEDWKKMPDTVPGGTKVAECRYMLKQIAVYKEPRLANEDKFLNQMFAKQPNGEIALYGTFDKKFLTHILEQP